MSDTPLQDEEEEEENRLAEAAERRFEEQQGVKQDGLHHATTEQPEASGHTFVNLSFEPETDAPLNSAEPSRDASAPHSHMQQQQGTNTNDRKPD